jgi:hypothetical protein
MAQSKQQKELIALAGLLVVAVATWYFYFKKHDSNPNAVSASGAYTMINAQDYSGILEQLKAARSTEYKSNGRNIFVATPEPPKDTGTVKTAGAKAFIPVGPPLPTPEPPPQLPWKFFGYGTLPAGGERRAFLTEGEEIHIVTEGETVLNHIRITHIGNESIEFEDINTHIRNSKPLEVTPSA